MSNPAIIYPPVVITHFSTIAFRRGKCGGKPMTVQEFSHAYIFDEYKLEKASLKLVLLRATHWIIIIIKMKIEKCSE